MPTLIAGATGATGKLLAEQLLMRGQEVRAIVRSVDRLPSSIAEHPQLKVTEASLLDLSDAELQEQVRACSAVALCLGHNLSFKGMFGPPRRLVTDAVRRLCGAVKSSQPVSPVKLVLMNTTGNRNRDLDESISIGQRAVIGFLRLTLPPVSDNEQAAEYLRTQIAQNDPWIGWVAVRPDNLTDEDEVTDHVAHPSPVRDAIFDAGRTSRINVARFMADLITDDDVWNTWKGRMPVLYNADTA